jgi:hypothetical protein
MADADIIQALRALADGRWGDWHGLPAGCERKHAEQVFGPSEPGPDGVGVVAGYSFSFRRYPAPAWAAGVVVWLNGDLVLAIQLNTPLASAWREVLGPPEDTAPSLLFSIGTQWIYASRGLTLHAGSDDRVIQIYVYAPTTPEEFKQSWMSQVEIRRIRIRR